MKLKLPPGISEQGDLDTSFGTSGTFELKVPGYDQVEPGGGEPLRALALVHDGSIMLAMGCRNLLGPSWQYGLAKLTPSGAFDASFGDNGVVIGALPPELTMSGTQAWPAPDRGTVLVLRSQASRSWTLVRHDMHGVLDTAFGSSGYVNLDAIRPDTEPFVVKGFVISGPGNGFFFIGTTKYTAENGDERYAGGIVFRFDASGRLNPEFAGKGYALIDVPLGQSGRVTDAVLQGDGKIVVSTATTSGNGRIVRLLRSGKPDPRFGTDGAFVVEGDSADRNEIEKLAWSEEAGLWAAGTVMTRSSKVGLLLALDDNGTIPASFNEGKLLEINYGLSEGNGGGLAFPMYIAVSAAGVTVVGRADYDMTGIKRMIMGRHELSGALDTSFADGKGFFTINPGLEGGNFIFFGIDLVEDRVTFEILSGNGGGGSNPDRVLLQRYISESPASELFAVHYDIDPRGPGLA